tara:strand:- start:472 stop:633 length:162 start_codon:yes stop_codon:yes gene_type:complete
MDNFLENLIHMLIHKVILPVADHHKDLLAVVELQHRPTVTTVELVELEKQVIL